VMNDSSNQHYSTYSKISVNIGGINCFLFFTKIASPKLSKTTNNKKMTSTPKNIFEYQTSVSPEERAKIKSQKPFTIWLTGLSGAGKTTIANLLETHLMSENKHSFILDGDNIRKGICSDLGFSDNDRSENLRRCAHVAKLMNDAGLIVISAFISPKKENRQMIREIVGNENFLMVYIKASFETCQKRDVKGLYKQATRGEIKNFTGMGSGYETPSDSDVILDTEKYSPEESAQKLLRFIQERLGVSLDIA
jgi:adenylylsulfate kinase